MKYCAVAISLLLHSLFFVEFKSEPANYEIISTKREVIAIKVKEQRVPKIVKSNLVKKKRKKILNNKKEVIKNSHTRLVEAQSKSRISPVYPERARLLGFEGRATVLAVIDEKGTIVSVKLVKSSGYEILDNEIIRSVRNATFVAASRGGEAIKSEKEITFNYELE